MGGEHRLVVRPSVDPACSFRLRRFGETGIVLTTILPLLESFGLVVVESVPMRLAAGPGGEPPLHIDDIGLRADNPYGPEALRFVPEIHGARLSSMPSRPAGRKRARPTSTRSIAWSPSPASIGSRSSYCGPTSATGARAACRSVGMP